MSDAEAACYRRHLSKASAVLEYGVGGSTVMAAKHKPRSLYCVETDSAWLSNVAADPAVAAMANAGAARLVHVDLGTPGKWGKPPRGTWLRWPRYARCPWRDGYNPDLVMVDGRFRVSCIMQALRHGSDHTRIVVHDFWKRQHYRSVLRFTDVVDRADTMAVLVRKSRASGLGMAWTSACHLLDRR